MWSMLKASYGIMQNSESSWNPDYELWSCIETWEEMQMQCYFRQVPSLFILFYKVYMYH